MSRPSQGAVDVHAHVVPAGVIDSVESGVDGVRLVREADTIRFRFSSGSLSAPVEPGLVDVHERLRYMDRQGVEIQLLSSFIDVSAHHCDPHSAVRYARLFNDSLAQLVDSHPDRFRAFATVPSQLDDMGAGELRRCVDDLGFVGAEIPAARAADPLWEPLWEAFEETASLVLLHPESSTTAQLPYFLGNFVGNPAETTLAAGALMFSGRVERFPNVSVLLVHGGGFLPYQIGRLDHGWQQYGSRFEAAMTETPRELLNRFYFDTVLHDPASLTHLLDTVGPGRVVLGTDYPFVMGDAAPLTTLESQAQLSPQDVERVKRHNALGALDLARTLRLHQATPRWPQSAP